MEDFVVDTNHKLKSSVFFKLYTIPGSSLSFLCHIIFQFYYIGVLQQSRRKRSDYRRSMQTGKQWGYWCWSGCTMGSQRKIWSHQRRLPKYWRQTQHRVLQNQDTSMPRVVRGTFTGWTYQIFFKILCRWCL